MQAVRRRLAVGPLLVILPARLAHYSHVKTRSDRFGACSTCFSRRSRKPIFSNPFLWISGVGLSLGRFTVGEGTSVLSLKWSRVTHP